MSDGKTDGTGIARSLAAQANPGSLLRPDALSRLVRRFIADVIDVLEKAQREGITRDAGAATVEASCRYYAGVMSGRVPLDGFVGGGDWLERGLPAYLRGHHRFSGEGEAAVAEAFAVIAKRVFEIVTRPAGHEAAIDQLVRSSLALFGGMADDAAVS